jgi:hypothetical protein
MSKREIKLEVQKHFAEPVRMTYASGADQHKTQGFTVKVIVFKHEPDAKYISGCWEIYSDDSSCYGEGTLSFDLEGSCFDYDGCYDLSHYVCDMLTENGYKSNEVDSRLF